MTRPLVFAFFGSVAAVTGLGAGCKSSDLSAAAESIGWSEGSESILCVPGAGPTLYHDPQHESPVRGDPGDVLLIPGSNFSPGSVVVYQASTNTTQVLARPPNPSHVPSTQTATQGAIVPLAVDANAVKVVLPMTMTAEQSYALWVANPDHACGNYNVSNGVLINDARPMWLSGSGWQNQHPYVYSSAEKPGLGRVIKIVGRNLEPAPAAQTRVRFVQTNTGGTGTSFTLTAANDGSPTTQVERYVANVTLPAGLPVLDYDITVSRDGVSWVPLAPFNAQNPPLSVLADPPPRAQFDVSTFGNGGPACNSSQGTFSCLGNGEDDTFCITRAVDYASRKGGGDVVFPAGTWNVNASCWDLNPQSPTYRNSVSDTYIGPDSVTYTYTPCTPLGSPGGIMVPAKVNLIAKAAVAPNAVTIQTGMNFVKPWLDLAVNKPTRQSLFLLLGSNIVQGLRFHDSYKVDLNDVLNPWTGDLISISGATSTTLTVFGNDVTIFDNFFDDTATGITYSQYSTLADGALGVAPPGHTNVVISQNRFGSLLSGVAMAALEDSVIANNTFWPGASVAMIAAGTRGSRHVDVSANLFDGEVSTYSGQFIGFRAGIFFPHVTSHEDLLVSGNTFKCIGTRPFNDGEAISFDDNKDFHGFRSGQTVTSVTPGGSSDTVTVSPAGGSCYDIVNKITTGQSCQISDDCPQPANFPETCTGDTLLSINNHHFEGRWLRVDYGPGLGQARKIISAARPAAGIIAFNVSPPFDVPPTPGISKIIVSQQSWQTYVVDNTVDNSCSGPPNTLPDNLRAWQAKGIIGVYGCMTDSVIESNTQLYAQGITFSSQYALDNSNPLADSYQFSLYFDEVRGNSITKSFGYGAAPNPGDIFGSGISLNTAMLVYDQDGQAITQADDDRLKNYMGFGLSISHNTLQNAGLKYPGYSSNIWAVGVGAAENAPLESPIPAYVDTLVFGNTVSGIPTAPAGGTVMAIANGEGAPGAGRPYYPQGTVICGNHVFNNPAGAQAYEDFTPSGEASTLTLCSAGCASHQAPDDFFAPGMVGCGGSVTWDGDQQLCGPGFTACTAAQWNAYRGNTTPTSDYWTSDNLQYLGPGPNACEAVTSGGNSCGTNRPMRVCTPGGADPHGNTCTWTGCGLGTMTNQFFGGCVANPTAGTLCCASGPRCANNKEPDEVFAPGMLGCGGSVTWDKASQLCGPGFSPCTAAQWNASRGNVAPANDYWTADNLQYLGSGPNACEAVTSGGISCGTNNPMRVCTPGGSDGYGNTCTWTGCGLGTMTNQFFGGCVVNPTAGTLCCAN